MPGQREVADVISQETQSTSIQKASPSHPRCLPLHQSLPHLPSVSPPAYLLCVNSSVDGESEREVSQRLGTLIPHTQSYYHRSRPGLRSRLSPNKATSLRLPPAAFHGRLSSLGSPSRARHAWSGRGLSCQAAVGCGDEEPISLEKCCKAWPAVSPAAVSLPFSHPDATAIVHPPLFSRQKMIPAS